MALPKTYQFAEQDQLTSAYSQLFCHPARIKILSLFKGGKTIPAAEVFEHIPLQRSTVSDHIAFMKRYSILLRAPLLNGRTGYKVDLEKYAEICLHLRHFILSELEEVPDLPRDYLPTYNLEGGKPWDK